MSLGCLALVSASPSLAQPIAAAFAYKMEGHMQTLTGAPTRDASFIMGGFQFVEPQVSSAQFSASLTLGPNSLGAYGRSTDGLTLSGRSPDYATRAALDSNYPNGTVGFRFGEPFTWEASLELTGDLYPGAPRVTNLAALQAIAGGSATIEWQPGAGALPDDTVVVSVIWPGGDLLFTSGAGAVGRTTIPVPSGREAGVTITALRTTARGEVAGAALAVGYGASISFGVRSTGALDTTPPRVTAVSPALDTVGVSPTARVQVTFDDTMRPIGLLRGGAEPQGKRQRVTWSEDQKTATFEFPAPLPAGPVELSFSGEASGFQAFRDIEGNFLAPGTLLTRFFVGNLPVFVQQPASIWPALGSSATLTTSVNWPGGGLTYQWLLNGVAVPGATNPTLTLTNFDLSRAGLYELRVTNAHGSVLSAPALISTDPSSRLPRAVIAASQEVPLNYNAEPITPGLPLTLSLRTANGVTAQYWRKNGERIAGATGLDLSFASLAESDTGIYDAVLTNASGTANTEPFTLVVKPGRPLPTYTLPRQTVSVFRGDSTNLALHATVPFGFQRGWQRDGQWIEQGGSQSTLSLSNIQQGGVYRFVVSNGLETVVAAEYALTLRERGSEAPYIVDQTSDVWFTEGGAALLSMTVQGALPMTYQWKHDGVALPGRNGLVLVVNQDPPGPTGIYTCVITNARGSVETGPMTVRFVTSRAAPPKPRIGREGGGPTSVVLGAGRSLSLRSDLPSNVPPVTRMQWRHNGNPLPNGGSSTLHVNDLTPQHSGAYTLVCGNSFGETTSDPFTLRVVGLDEPPYRDREKVSLRVAVGERFTLSAPFAQAPDLRYRWRLNGRDVTAENSIGIEPPGNFHVLNAQATHAGAWTVEAANAAGITTAAVADVVVEPGPPASARLVNVSTRASAGQGSATLIAGFTLSGTGPKRLLLRAVGPAIEKFGVRNAVKNPRLAVYRGAQLIASNDDWVRQPGLIEVDFARRQAGALLLDAQASDAALVATLEPGAYTLQFITDEPGGGAVGLIEAYDLEAGYPPLRLTNLSSRLLVGTGEQTAIPGFVVRGQGTKTYLVRAVGPGLGKFGVTGVLADPQIVVTGLNSRRHTNDDWESATRAAIVQAAERVGAFALDAGSKDAALLVTLPAGDYTVQVSGAGGATGIALVELYEVPEGR